MSIKNILKEYSKQGYMTFSNLQNNRPTQLFTHDIRWQTAKRIILV